MPLNKNLTSNSFNNVAFVLTKIFFEFSIYWFILGQQKPFPKSIKIERERERERERKREREIFHNSFLLPTLVSSLLP